jgi:putative ABC transport system permease protein
LTVAAEKLFVNRAGGPRSLTSITLETAPGVSTAGVTSKVTRVLRQRYNVVPDQTDPFTLFVPTSLMASFNSIATALTAFLGVIGAISLVVGGIGIMNIMLVSVTERTREIGVRKAVGASPGSIRAQFLVEALTVTCIAGIIGVGVGIAAAMAAGQVQLQEGESFQPQVQVSSVAIAFGVSVAIGVIFGLYPAWRASRLQPVEALRYE